MRRFALLFDFPEKRWLVMGYRLKKEAFDALCRGCEGETAFSPPNTIRRAELFQIPTRHAMEKFLGGGDSIRREVGELLQRGAASRRADAFYFTEGRVREADAPRAGTVVSIFRPFVRTYDTARTGVAR